MELEKTEVARSEKRIGDACRKNRIWAVVGTPYDMENTRYNMAIVINDEGETVYKQARIQLVGGDKWAQPGNSLSLFEIDGNLCSLIICHDSRYPELVRIPAIKGAKLVFYISWESGIRSEDKIEPYRAQVVARAVENGVYVVHANAPRSLDPVEGSHGQSRIVSPRGVLLQEASMMSEQVLIEDLHLTMAKRINAPRSLRAEFLREWWQNGLEKVAMPGTGLEMSRNRQPLK